MEQGCLYWITGLSGAGKTTIGNLLFKELKARKPNVFLLDGDVARWAYGDAAGYTRQEREAVAYRHARVCKMIVDQDIDVICCTVSMFDGVRQWNRQHFDKYREIFLDVPMDVLIKRDKKQLYSRTQEGATQNVVGLDQQSEYPRSPDLRIVNDGASTPQQIIEQIRAAFPELRR